MPVKISHDQLENSFNFKAVHISMGLYHMIAVLKNSLLDKIDTNKILNDRFEVL